ncbi:MAG: NUDIX hydrolase [Pseudolabrys sp.]|nr:NUDIX hydrolase [Pseudolabrys sp.]
MLETSHIRAAGGIVVRRDPEPRFAIVRLRKRKAWVLPKGKLNPNENALAAARREVLEETGHRVSIHEFVGALSYRSRGRSKIVQFWGMQAVGGPARKLMRDVLAVDWLPLDKAIEKLSHPREQIFLASVGPTMVRALEAQARPARSPAARRKASRRVVSPAPTSAPDAASGEIATTDWAIAPVLPIPTGAETDLDPAEPVVESAVVAVTAPAGARSRNWLQRHLLGWLGDARS